jgi:hypothetical protein
MATGFVATIAAAAPDLADHYELSAGRPASSAVRGIRRQCLHGSPTTHLPKDSAEGSCLHEMPKSSHHVQCTWQAHAQPCTQPVQEAEAMEARIVAAYENALRLMQWGAAADAQWLHCMYP